MTRTFPSIELINNQHTELTIYSWINTDSWAFPICLKWGSHSFTSGNTKEIIKCYDLWFSILCFCFNFSVWRKH